MRTMNQPIDSTFGKVISKPSRIIGILALTLLVITNSFATTLPNGVVFRVAGNDKLIAEKTEVEKSFAPVTKSGESAEYGVYNDFIRAQKAKNQLKEKGLQEAEITAYFNQSKISLNDALTLLNNINNSDQFNSSPSISINQMDALMKGVAASSYYYTVTFDPANQNLNKLYQLNGKIETRKTKNGLEVISFGKFVDFESAKAYLVLISELGIKSVQVSAWNDKDAQITLEEASRLEVTAKGQ